MNKRIDKLRIRIKNSRLGFGNIDYVDAEVLLAEIDRLTANLETGKAEGVREERERIPEWLRELAAKYPLGTQMVSPIDDLDGEVVGYYRTREGKTGLDLQQNGKRIVHVYQTKWWEQLAAIRKNEGAPHE